MLTTGISVISLFILRQIRLRVTGKYHRHGYAAASFGAPVSLNDFQAENGRKDIKDLARLLMVRIGEEVPVLPVPMVARALILADGPISRQNLDKAVQSIMAELPQAHVHLPRDDEEYAVEVGLRNLVKRGIVAQDEDSLSIVEEERPILAYYAASIEHLFRTRSD